MVKAQSITKFADHRGTICIAEVGKEVPFAIAAVTVMYGGDKPLQIESGQAQVLVVKGAATITSAEATAEITVDQSTTFFGPSTIIADSKEDIVLVLAEREVTSTGALDLELTTSFFGKHTERAFYLKDIVVGQDRGGHAHQYCHQSLVCLKGSLEVVLNDGDNTEVIKLYRGSGQLHIPPFIWAKEQNFSEGAICLVLASHSYNREGYMDTIEEMKKIRDEIQ